MNIICTSVRKAIYILWIYTGSVLQCSALDGQPGKQMRTSDAQKEIERKKLNFLLRFYKYGRFSAPLKTKAPPNTVLYDKRMVNLRWLQFLKSRLLIFCYY